VHLNTRYHRGSAGQALLAMEHTAWLIGSDKALPEDGVRLESAFGFSETIARLRSALEAKGFAIMAVIDHAAAAKAVGLAMPPTTVLIYGNPKGGTPLMLAAPDFALELPLRVLVREDESGQVHAVFNAAGTLEGKHGLPAGMAERLAPAESVIQSAIVRSH
jgi:uncharacterized protein (DUF302 family)